MQALLLCIYRVYLYLKSSSWGQVISLILLLHLSSTTESLSQKKLWDKTIGGNGDDQLYSLQQTSDGGYILGGSSSSVLSGDKSDGRRNDCLNDYCASDYWVVKIKADGTKEWDKTFGGTGEDVLTSLQQTNDGGYILGGRSNSGINGDKTQNKKGEFDYWVIKLDKNGHKQWEKTIGSNLNDQLTSLQQSSDGGYILAGTSDSGKSGDKSEASKGGDDYWVVKLNANGKKVWDKTIGGNRNDRLASIQQTQEGGYILGGTSSSDISGDKTEAFRDENIWDYFFSGDYWVVKLSADGTKEWDKTIGGDREDNLQAIQQTKEGGYILGGTSESGISGDKSEFTRNGFYYRGYSDYWIVKLKVDGTKEWDKTLGGQFHDYLASVQQTLDGNYIVGGHSSSDISGDKTEALRNGCWEGEDDECGLDYWVLMLKTDGTIIWDKSLGGYGKEYGEWDDNLAVVRQTRDGNFILGGSSQSSTGGEKSENNKGESFTSDFWIVKLDFSQNQGITFNPILDKTFGEAPFTLSAKASSGLPVTYSVVSGPATVKGNVLTLTGTGTVTVKASQAGNATYKPVEVTQTFLAEAAVPVVKQWERTYGGNNTDWLATAKQTSEGGYILGGYSNSNKGGDKSQTNYGTEDMYGQIIHDYWIVKLKPDGTKEWDRTLGGKGDDQLTSLQQTSDGGYLLGGWSNSGKNGDKTGTSKGDFDYWVVKINADGTKEWDKTIGGNDHDRLTSLQQTSDGGYILGGWSRSGKSGDKSEAQKEEYDYSGDYWIVKLKADGSKEWDRSLGGQGEDELTSLQQTTDGGYILGGWSSSGISDDKSEAPKGLTDYWIVKLKADGTKEWDKTIGGDNVDNLSSLQQTSDGGYILGGYSASGISGDKREASKGSSDYWIVKLNTHGKKEWDKIYGGNGQDKLQTLQLTKDGNYILSGFSYSNIGGDKSEESRGLQDYWIIKLTEKQTKSETWNMRYGGNGTDNLTSTIKTNDGGYLSGGYTTSGASGDKSQSSQGKNDYWIVKSDKNGKKLWDKRYGGTADDYLNRVIQTQDGGYLLAGSSLSGKSGDKSQASNGNRDYWLVKTDKQGNKEWDKTYGGSGEDELKKVIQLASGEYVLGGYSNSPVSDDKSQNSQGSTDYWLIKISSTGTKIWDKRYGGSQDEALGSFTETKDGGFFLGGTSYSGKSGDKSQASRGASDYWCVKTDKDGHLLWEKSFGGNGADEVYSVRQISGNHFYLAGTSNSSKSGDKSQDNKGGKDYWLLTLDKNGRKIWDKTYGGGQDDELRASTYSDKGHFILAGHSYSGLSGDKTQASQGESDYWVVEVDQQGQKVQDQRYGGTGPEELRTVTQTKDGGLLLGGRSNSGVSGDRTQPSQGSTDYWLVKVAPMTSSAVATRTTTQPESKPSPALNNLVAYPNPFQDKINMTFSLETTQAVTLTAHDSQGRKIKTLFQGEAQAKQQYQVEWQAKNQAAGLYFLRMQTPGKTHHQKVLLVK